MSAIATAILVISLKVPVIVKLDIRHISANTYEITETSNNPEGYSICVDVLSAEPPTTVIYANRTVILPGCLTVVSKQDRSINVKRILKLGNINVDNLKLTVYSN